MGGVWHQAGCCCFDWNDCSACCVEGQPDAVVTVFGDCTDGCEEAEGIYTFAGCEGNLWRWTRVSASGWTWTLYLECCMQPFPRWCAFLGSTFGHGFGGEHDTCLCEQIEALGLWPKAGIAMGCVDEDGPKLNGGGNLDGQFLFIDCTDCVARFSVSP